MSSIFFNDTGVSPVEFISYCGTLFCSLIHCGLMWGGMLWALLEFQCSQDTASATTICRTRLLQNACNILGCAVASMSDKYMNVLRFSSM